MAQPRHDNLTPIQQLFLENELDMWKRAAVEAQDARQALADENMRLCQALRLADVVYNDLDTFMQFDECANDSENIWPDCDCEGCSYCATSHAMNEYKSFVSELTESDQRPLPVDDYRELPY